MVHYFPRRVPSALMIGKSPSELIEFHTIQGQVIKRADDIKTR